MKTALQHFNELPQPYGQMAIEETIKQGYKHLLKLTFKSKSKTISGLFAWSKSEIGYDFWNAICNNCEHLESQSKQDKG
jgi:hypothetical protein